MIETSLGYFINPIVTVLLGVSSCASACGSRSGSPIGIAVVAVGRHRHRIRRLPVDRAHARRSSFGFYGLVKKQIGPSVDAVSGLTLESLWLDPGRDRELIVVGDDDGPHDGHRPGRWHALLLSLAGVVTAIPLLLFAAGARRVPLTVIGLLQFVAPILQFIIGAWLLGEPMPLERWIGFGLVWLAADRADGRLAAVRAPRPRRLRRRRADLTSGPAGRSPRSPR